jgi:hypothetical protein
VPQRHEAHRDRCREGWRFRVFVLAALALVAACGEGEEPEGDPTVPRAPDSSPVRRTVPGDYPSIQEALDDARIGDTILVAPGVWSGPLEMPAAPVILASTVLTGSDSSVVAGTVINGNGSDWVVHFDTLSGHSRILGLTLRNATDCIRASGSFDFEGGILTDCGDGIAYEAGSGGHVAHSRIFENRDDGVEMSGDHIVLLEHNLIRGNGDDGIEIRFSGYDGAVKRTVIRDNLVRGNRGDGVRIIGHAEASNLAVLLERNRVVENQGTGISCRAPGSPSDDEALAGAGAVLEEEIVFVENLLEANGAGLTCGYLSTRRPSTPESPET